LPDHVEEIWQNHSLSDEMVRMTVEILSKAVEETDKEG